MGLCENVYRRGGVYWFRRRVSLGDHAGGAYMRVSLRVRDPNRARQLARRVGAEADRLRNLPMLDPSQQKALLKAFIAEQAGRLDGVARIVAHQHADNAAGAEPLAEQIRRDRNMAEVYAALGARGVAAAIGEAEAAALAASGLNAGEIQDIKDRVRLLRDWLPRLYSDGGIGAEGPRGPLGPPNLAFRAALGKIDADDKHQRGRRATAVAAGHVRRHERRPSLRAARPRFGRDRLPGDARGCGTKRFRAAGSRVDADRAATGFRLDTGSRSSPSRSANSNNNDTGTAARFRLQDFRPDRGDGDGQKGLDWKITNRGDQDVSDSAESYIFLGRILVKMIGVDDVRALNGQTPMQLRMTLQSLPTAYGKAQAHWDLSFDQAIAAAEKEGKPIGRHPTTINKYINSLQAFFNFLEANTVRVPDLTKQIKNIKVRAPKKKATKSGPPSPTKSTRRCFRTRSGAVPMSSTTAPTGCRF